MIRWSRQAGLFAVLGSLLAVMGSVIIVAQPAGASVVQTNPTLAVTAPATIPNNTPFVNTTNPTSNASYTLNNSQTGNGNLTNVRIVFTITGPATLTPSEVDVVVYCPSNFASGSAQCPTAGYPRFATQPVIAGSGGNITGTMADGTIPAGFVATFPIGVAVNDPGVTGPLTITSELQQNDVTVLATSNTANSQLVGGTIPTLAVTAPATIANNTPFVNTTDPTANASYSVNNSQTGNGNLTNVRIVFTITGPAALTPSEVDVVVYCPSNFASGSAQCPTAGYPRFATQPVIAGSGGNITGTMADGTIPAGFVATFPIGVAVNAPGVTGPLTITSALQQDDASGNPQSPVVVLATSNIATSALITPSAPAFTADSPPTTATVGTAYSYSYTASGNPAPTFTVASGTLPTGLSLNSTSGLLSGTPTTAGAFTFTVTAANGVLPNATSPSTTITVSAASAPVFTADTPPTTGTVGVAYSYSYTASGNPAPTFTVASGTLPTGLSLNSTSGLLSGTPTTAGTFTFTVTAANGVLPNATSPSTTITIGAAPPPPPPPPPPTTGYWMVASDGGIFSFGNARFFGSTGNIHLNQPIVGMTSTRDSQGYWLVASDGGIFAFGDAGFFGSTGAIHLNKPIVGMASTPDGRGYWLVASDGGIFSFGDAGFYGSTGNIHLNQPVVGMAPTPDGHGYWMVASDGGIFAFGDAGFYGSTGNIHLNKPIVGMDWTPSGHGYWLVASDGGIFSFGDAGFYGSTGNIHLNQPVVGMTSTNDGGGYWMVASDGGIFAFGDAPFNGSMGGAHLNQPIVGMAAT